jgi:glycosyltransferase involved in cell wall biosynthesis
MHIAIDDGFSTSRTTGVGRYTLAVVEALRRHAPAVRVTHLHFPRLERLHPRQLRRLPYLVWLATTYPRHLQRLDADIAHFTNYQAAGWKPGGLRYVVTAHDLTAFLWPGAYSPIYMAYLRAALRHAVRVADCVLADSEAVRQEILRCLPVRPERVKVCYIAPALQAMPRPEAEARLHRLAPALLADPFILFVGRLERRKNLVPLVQAFGRLQAHWPRLRLALAGQPGFGYGAVEAARRAFPAGGERVHILRGCGDDELRALYTACALFVLPSIYEGYGIPLLEAMTCGAPILASDIPTSREVCQEAAHYAPPTATGLQAGAEALLASQELRAELAGRGRNRVAAAFTAEQTARQLLEAYQ